MKDHPIFGNPPTPKYKYETKIFQPNLSKARTPPNTLFNYVKHKKIPISDPDFTLDEDNQYYQKNVDDDYELIKQIMESKQKFDEYPYPIIAIKRPSHIAPYLYYIRKDLLDNNELKSEVTVWRKKKSIKLKPKRQIKKCRCEK